MARTPKSSAHSLEDRLRLVEDRLEIYNLIASHPAIVDSLSGDRHAGLYTLEGTLDRGPLGATKMHDRGAANDGEMQGAAKMGLAHLPTLPYVKIGRDTALAFSYVAVTVRDPTADTIAVPAHGEGPGHRLFRIVANRWDLARIDGAWKIRRREIVLADGSDAPRDLQRSILAADIVD
jgi:hypothetical protein